MIDLSGMLENWRTELEAALVDAETRLSDARAAVPPAVAAEKVAAARLEAVQITISRAVSHEPISSALAALLANAAEPKGAHATAAHRVRCEAAVKAAEDVLDDVLAGLRQIERAINPPTRRQLEPATRPKLEVPEIGDVIIFPGSTNTAAA